jgi:hypothetical protein
MKKTLIILTICNVFLSCSPKIPETLGESTVLEGFGYQPIDPLPLNMYLSHDSSSVYIKKPLSAILSNNSIAQLLPDETMRLAIGQIDGTGNVSFGTAKLGIKGSSYIVILDYIKFKTEGIPLEIAKDSSGKIIDFRAFYYPEKEDTTFMDKPDMLLPVYVGVGLRLTASLTVNEGSIDLGNLIALGIAAESKQISGTLVIQTLGISGKSISPLIPMPSQINTTSIQTAIMSLASIKARLYDVGVELNPRVVGFYNNLGGGQKNVRQLISLILYPGISLDIENEENKDTVVPKKIQ